MTRTLLQKVALVTGSAGGIGYEIARTFAREGAGVVLTDLRTDTCREAADSLQKEGLSARAIACDVTDESAFQDAIFQTVQMFGRLDILVNNAGLQYISPVEEFPSDKFERLLRVMLTAPFYGIKHAFPVMKRQGSGRILNMASINGLVGFAGKAAYNSAKHGVIGLTKVTAIEGAPHGITVNALCPGYVDTPLVRNQLEDLARTRQVPLERVLADVIYPLVPQQRLLDPQEIADYALFLCSEKGRGITGQAVVIDGGYTAQ